ncbi:hypothetical protein ACH5RR_017466 [Cinchona calisaya]|uniref:Cystatin domain-containing protein n=1 Tax=Cinchona calisaya TaxID=153742 RepID=A0ABD2ZMG6_9GENT
MAYNSHYLPILTILAAVFLFFDLPSTVLGNGEWQEVDPNDPKALVNGIFAIDEHNKVAEPKLLFESIFKAEKQVVEQGINYRIVIQAVKDSRSFSSLYQAIVFVTPKFKKLISFNNFSTKSD